MIRITTKTYRGEDGYLISGTKDGSKRRYSVFTPSLGQAQTIKRQIKAGEEISFQEEEEK